MLLLRKFFALACWRKIMLLTLHLQIRSHHRQLIAIHILELAIFYLWSIPIICMQSIGEMASVDIFLCMCIWYDAASH